MVSILNQPEIRQALHQISQIGVYAGWFLLGYTDDNTVALKARGNGGVEELVPLLKDNEIQYFVVRILDQDKDGLETGRTVFVTWTGSQVSVLKKGKKATHAATVADFCSPHHATLTATNRNNINTHTLKDRSGPLSGSHIID